MNKAVTVLVTLAATFACGPETIDLAVSQVLVTEPILGERAAMYFTVTNNGSAHDVLLGVATEAARVAEIHRTEVADGTIKIVPIAMLRIPAGTRVELAPGGYHVMLTQIDWTLEPGDRFDVTLRFRRAGELVARARVVAYDELEEYLESGRRDSRGTR